MNKPFKYIIIIAGVLVSSYAVFMAAYFATSAPGFCASCHEIKSYVASWGKSPHQKVGCLFCHEPRGALGKFHSKSRGLNYVYRQFAGQYSVIVETQIFDQNCIDCHLGNYSQFPNAVKIGKDHYEYLKNKRRCAECHRDIGHQNTLGLEKKMGLE